MRTLILALLATAVSVAGPASAQDKKYNLTVAGYSPGGLVSTVGVGMDRALNKAYPGSTVTYQTSSGGLANAMMLEGNKVPLAFIADTELAVAIAGRKPIPKALTNLRQLFRPYAPSSRFQMSHMICNKDWAEKNGIKTIADIAAKKPAMKIALNRPGNLDGDVALGVLAANNITPADIEKAGGQLVRAASGEATPLMLDRRLDCWLYGISYNHPRIRELSNGLDIVMLPMTEATAKKVADDLGAEACKVSEKEYKFLTSDSASVCVGMSVVVRADMPDELAYNITKGIVENADTFKAAHRLLNQVVTLQTLAEKGQAPFHPGAEKYLREKGLIK